MTERKPERYAWHADQDRSTAGERIPIGAAPWQRYEFAEGVYIGGGDSFVHLPPRPRRPTGWELAMAKRKAWRERHRRRTILGWKIAGWVALVLGAVLMVAVTHG